MLATALVALAAAGCADTVRPVLGNLKIGPAADGPFVMPVLLNEQSPFVYPYDAWERGVLQHSLDHPEDRSKPWAPLLAEGIAFRAKCLQGVETDESPRSTAQADDEETAANDVEQLITDAAVGLALLQEMQRAIDQLVAAGESGEAKRLSTFRNKVAQAVGQLKDCLGREDYERAENKSGAMVAPAQEEILRSHSIGPERRAKAARRRAAKRAGGQSAEELIGELTDKADAQATEQPTEPVNTLPRKLVLLAVLSLIWVVFYMPRLFDQPPPLLRPMDFSELPGEESILAAMREQKVGRGQYAFPCPKSPADMKSPEMLEKYERGPVGFAVVLPDGPPAMGKSLALWFIHTLALSFLVAYLAGRTLGPGVHYLAVFRVVGTAAILGYCGYTASDSIWKGLSWSNTVKHIIDGVIYALLTAGVFGWLWP